MGLVAGRWEFRPALSCLPCGGVQGDDNDGEGGSNTPLPCFEDVPDEHAPAVVVHAARRGRDDINAALERDAVDAGGAVPTYDRACDGNMLSSARKRRRGDPGAAARTPGRLRVLDDDAAGPSPADAAPQGDDATTQAPRAGAVEEVPSAGMVSTSRCFNCGSYSHALSRCPKPHDPVEVARNRAAFDSTRRLSGQPALPDRYHGAAPRTQRRSSLRSAGHARGGVSKDSADDPGGGNHGLTVVGGDLDDDAWAQRRGGAAAQGEAGAGLGPAAAGAAAATRIADRVGGALGSVEEVEMEDEIEQGELR
ncbi:unnamed protein product [Pedinophyceae sp. YPF-701]|nr:unnamed protein product [Pedinophyceae sp. YPF-701]